MRSATCGEPRQLPKKPNYSFEKRKKELDREAKKNEKLRRKRESARDRSDEPTPPEADDGSTTSSE